MFRFAIYKLLKKILKEIKKMSIEMDELRAEVAANTAGDESAILLIQGLADRIDQLANNPVELRAFAAELRASRERLATSVFENTPTEP